MIEESSAQHHGKPKDEPGISTSIIGVLMALLLRSLLRTPASEVGAGRSHARQGVDSANPLAL